MISQLSAGFVAPSDKRYSVCFTHEHKTLKIGDEVVMIETPIPNLKNLLLRTSDMTLHDIQDEGDQYVHLLEVQHE